MKIEQQFSDPEHVVDRQPYRLRIEGKDGQAIEIIEQMSGGFLIVGATLASSVLVLRPIDSNKILVGQDIRGISSKSSG